jgi:class 3 adenylate cyclase
MALRSGSGRRSTPRTPAEEAEARRSDRSPRANVPIASYRQCSGIAPEPAVAPALLVWPEARCEDALVDDEIRYVRNGGVAIAYQVVGEGEVDLVFVPAYGSNLVYAWQWPRWRSFYERLARSFRLILFDKRGTGISDHGGQFAALETRMEDLRAVLDAAGAATPVVLAANEGCAMATLFAATYPERVRALVLFNPATAPEARLSRETLEELADLRERWGTREFSDELLRAGCPPLYESEDDRRHFANSCRVNLTPAAAYALNRANNETDLRDVLPAVRVATLVMYLPHEETQEQALEVAARIPSAQTLRIPGQGWFGLHVRPGVVDEVERFVAGEELPQVPESVLATLLFTDIVGSTEQAADLGDRGWRDLLAQHNAIVRRELARFRGEERDTAGDGFFATFDGPARAIRAAQAIVESVQPLGVSLRAGVHIGECELHEGKLAGIALSVGARIAAAADTGEVLVSGTVRDLVAGSGLRFEDRGQRELKGIPGTWQLYAASGEE